MRVCKRGNADEFRAPGRPSGMLSLGQAGTPDSCLTSHTAGSTPGLFPPCLASWVDGKLDGRLCPRWQAVVAQQDLIDS